MDTYTWKLIGFATHGNPVDGSASSRMFNRIATKQTLPDYLSADNDPLFPYHRRQENLRITGFEEIKSLPYTPISHLFVEGPIGTPQCKLLDYSLLWYTDDLPRKLTPFQRNYNNNRAHTAHNENAPA